MNTSNIQSGLTTAKDGVMTLIKFIVNSVAVPILSAVILGFLVFQITGAISAHREGQDYSLKIKLIVGAVIVLAVVVSFPAWGWKMIG